jgi:hypothetical protein
MDSKSQVGLRLSVLGVSGDVSVGARVEVKG